MTKPNKQLNTDYKYDDVKQVVTIDGVQYSGACVVNAIIEYRDDTDRDDETGRYYYASIQGFAADINNLVTMIEKGLGKQVDLKCISILNPPLVPLKHNEQQVSHYAYWGEPEYEGRSFDEVAPLARPQSDADVANIATPTNTATPTE